jgi:hypothetical protein
MFAFIVYTLQQKVRIFCICPISLQQVGKGYAVSKPRAWLVKVAPVLQLCLCILKMAVQAYGIPLPIPHLVDGALDATLNKMACIDKLSQALSDTVSNAVKDGIVEDTVADALDDVNEHLSSITDDADDKLVKRVGKKVLRDTTSAYNDMFHLLLLLEEKTQVAPYGDWKPKDTGLHRVVSACDGSVAWVSSARVDLFQRKGKLALRDPSSQHTA